MSTTKKGTTAFWKPESDGGSGFALDKVPAVWY
jgi:hypothetical protein